MMWSKPALKSMVRPAFRLALVAVLAACTPAGGRSKSKSDASGGGFTVPETVTGGETGGGITTGITTGGNTTGGETTGEDTTGGQTTGGDIGSDVVEGDDTTAGETTGAEDAGPPVDPGPPPPPPTAKDTDEDGIPDKEDNCSFDQNPDQLDLDADGLGDTCDPDVDGDGVFNDADCEPLDAEVSPGNPETCDGFDNNCDGDIDGADSVGCTKYYLDEDNDGAGLGDTMECLCEKELENQVPFAGDCNDQDPAMNPWAYELCNGLDENCNLIVDDGCDDDDDGYCDAQMVLIGTPAVCPLGGGDCFDWSDQVHPAAYEIPADGLDNNCDGTKTGEPTGSLEPDCSNVVCFGQSNDAVRCGLDLCYPNLPDMVQSVKIWSPTGSDTGQAYNVVDHFGSKSNDLAPFGPPSYVLLATGPATGTSHSTNIGGTSVSDPFSSDGYQTYNNMEIELKLKAPPGAKGFSIDYIYFSEEYEEYIGSQFNDKFYIFLQAPQTTGSQKTVINFTQCSNPSIYFDFQKDGQKWCYIAINTAFSEPCSNPTTSIAGTGFECGPGGSTNGSSTGWLQTTWPIAPNEVFTLTFHIHDTSDGIYDSEVILDNFVWETDTVVGGTASHN